MLSPNGRECPEWSLLKQVAVVTDDNGVPAAAEYARSQPLDVDRLVGLAARHSLAPALAWFQQRAGLGELLPVGSRRMLRDSWDHNRARTDAYLDEGRRIWALLAERGITVAVTKGLIAQARVYDGLGIRVFNDIDLMAEPGTATAIADALCDAGYQIGTAYDHATGRLVPISRRDQLNYRLSPDHLPHLSRLASGPLNYFVLDVALDFCWHGAPWHVPVEQAVVTKVELAELGIPALDPVHDFLFLVLHVFREGWRTAKLDRKDIRLAQFADLLRHWWRFGQADPAPIAAAVRAYGLAAPLAWVLGHTDDLFGSTIVAELGLDPPTASWLNSACRTPGEYLCWAGNMDNRLRSGRAQALTPHPDPAAVASCLPEQAR